MRRSLSSIRQEVKAIAKRYNKIKRDLKMEKQTYAQEDREKLKRPERLE
jgi:hypothetical protein